MAKQKTETKEETPPSLGLATLGDKFYSMAPRNFQEAVEAAKLFAASDLVPKDFKGKEGNCLIAMQMGAEVGIPPLMAIQNIAVINGRPTLFGSLGKALLLQNGCRVEERDIKEVETLGEARCQITRPDGSKPIVRTFSKANAVKAKLWDKVGPWSEYPFRMLMWRAFWLAANDGAADYLKGFKGAEEVRDYIDTTGTEESQEAPISEPRRASEKAKAQDADMVQAPLKETVDQSTGEIHTEPAEDNTEPLEIGNGWKKMKSRMAGTCSTCHEKMPIGEEIFYDPDARRAHHATHFANA